MKKKKTQKIWGEVVTRVMITFKKYAPSKPSTALKSKVHTCPQIRVGGQKKKINPHGTGNSVIKAWPKPQAWASQWDIVAFTVRVKHIPSSGYNKSPINRLFSYYYEYIEAVGSKSFNTWRLVNIQADHFGQQLQQKPSFFVSFFLGKSGYATQTSVWTVEIKGKCFTLRAWAADKK